MAEGATEDGEVEPLSWKVYVGVGLLWFASLQVLGWGGVEADAPYRWVSTVFFAVMGGACWYNGRQCGALHCRISGPGYVLVAVVSAVSALGVIDVDTRILMGVFLAIAVVSYAIEAYVERREPQPS